MTPPQAEVSWTVNGEQRLRATGSDRGASDCPIACPLPQRDTPVHLSPLSLATFQPAIPQVMTNERTLFDTAKTAPPQSTDSESSQEAGSLVSQLNRVGAHTSPKGFWKSLYVRTVRAGLYWDQMERVCEETPPPKDTIKAKYARRIWTRDPGALIALRKYRALGEKPTGKYRWITSLLENDVVEALEKGGETSYRNREDGATEIGGDTPMAFHVLNFLRQRWSKKLRWGDEATVFHHAYEGGEFTHYCDPGLSNPAAEILRQYQIMRRFQEHETKCRQVLREEFGFEFFDPPARIL